MEESFRTPTEHEQEILRRMLEVEFPGRKEVREQLLTAQVKQVDVDGTLALVTSSTTRAPTISGVPVEGECRDQDGMRVHVLLLMVDGMINRLEIFREDALEVMRPPIPGELVLAVGEPDEPS